MAYSSPPGWRSEGPLILPGSPRRCFKGLLPWAAFSVLLAVPLLLTSCQLVQAPIAALKEAFLSPAPVAGDKGREEDDKGRLEGDRGAEDGDKVEAPPPLLPSVEEAFFLDSGPPPDALPPEPSVIVRRGRFAPRQSVYAVLAATGIGRKEMHEALRAGRAVHRLSKVGAGRRYEVAVGEEGLRRFTVQVDGERQVRIYRSRAGRFRARVEKIPYEVKVVRFEGKIRGSLFGTVAQLGASPVVANQLVQIFGWVINFHKDLRAGDDLRVLVEQRHLHGIPIGFGRILLAEFRVRGKKRAAVYFGRGRGDYFTPRGETLRRAFLRSPLRYTRISSRFSRRRYHPILKRYRPHLGVDYAAPRGTPVRTVADGVVTLARWKGAAGKMVKIRHGRGYRTAYLHLSRFARGIRPGRRVRQGQVIAYVGTTGLSTGPHLDFRITRRGRALNPLSTRLPAGMPVPRKWRAEFRRVVRERRALHARAPRLEGAGAKMAAAGRAKPRL